MARMIHGKNRIIFITKSASEVVDIRSIIYVETDGRKLNVITENEAYSLFANIDDIRKILTQYTGFINCHKTFVVNMYMITKMKDGKIVFRNGTEKYLGKNNFIAARKKFNTFMSELSESE